MLEIAKTANEKGKIALHQARRMSNYYGLNHLSMMMELGLMEEFVDKDNSGIPRQYYRLTHKGQQALALFRE